MDVVKLILPNRQQIEFQIALVDEPAIESNFMAFTKEGHFQFKEVDKAERLLMGYFMIADMEILRVDAKRGAYKVVFPKESIDTIIENFQLNGLANNMNEMHNSGQLSEGVFVRNHWQIDSKKGIKAPDGFKTEADGSWFGVVKCENDDVYQKALDGTFNGFSIEGKFIEEAIDKYFKVDCNNSTLENLYNKFNKPMNELKELFAALKGVFEKEDKAVEPTQKFEELLLVDGETKVTIEPAVEVGAAIVLYSADGEPIPAPIGSYELQDGKVIVVEVDGVIASVTEPTTEEEEMNPDVKKDAPVSAPDSAVKRLIERIEKVSEYASQEDRITDLEKQLDHAHKENDAVKTALNEFKKVTEDAIAKLMGKEAKEPIQKQHKGFDFGKEKQDSKYPWMDKLTNDLKTK